ncbi:hAT dimerization domain-containing protein [Trifolium repens]|jgi:hypothetical protein|nr:hAT dimerization domain-containing protein [Trifolium repens]
MSLNLVTNGSTAATIGSGGTSVRQNRNTAGKKTDIAWNHGVAIDKTGKKIKCKNCEKIISGGVYQLKHHLAGTQKDVVVCTAVPIEVKAQMWDVVASLQQKLVKKTRTAEFEEQIDVIGESADHYKKTAYLWRPGALTNCPKPSLPKELLAANGREENVCR